MSKKYLAAAAVAALLFLSLPADAKKTDLLRFDKGETTNDHNGCEVSISNEYPSKDGGVSLKVTVNADSFYVAETPPKRGVWEGYESLNIGLFNPTKRALKFIFVIKPKSQVEYNSRMDFSFVAEPGQNNVEIKLAGSKTNGGAPMSYKERIAIWSLDAPLKKGECFYLQYLTLDSAEEK